MVPWSFKQLITGKQRQSTINCMSTKHIILLLIYWKLNTVITSQTINATYSPNISSDEQFDEHSKA